MNPRRLDPNEWHQIQHSVPIACVDVLPLQLSGGDRGTIERVGLILRETPHQGRRWCLVGGRLCRNESFPEAISREIRDALGNQAQFKLREDIQPDYVAQYFTVSKESGGFDPRQHAVGLTFCVLIQGNIHPQGEALSFAWFHCSQLPAPEEFGFNQDRVVVACLARFRLQ
jgi:ADP-ribose pyrophosphatase YjhB (NUDIX family)